MEFTEAAYHVKRGELEGAEHDIGQLAGFLAYWITRATDNILPGLDTKYFSAAEFCNEPKAIRDT